MNVAERARCAPTDAMLVVHCLGALRVKSGDQDIRIRTRKAKALLAVLTLQERPVSRTVLADLLWSDRQAVQAKASVRQAVFELQHLACPPAMVVTSNRDELSLATSALVTDLDLIRRAAEDGNWPTLIALLDASDIGLLTDLDGLDAEFDDWLRLQRAHEPAKTIACVLRAAHRCAADAGPAEALALVAEVLRLEPLNEEATRFAMRLSYDCGDRVAVHRYFASLRDRLREDLAADPSFKTMDLLEQLGSNRAEGGPRPHLNPTESHRPAPAALHGLWPGWQAAGVWLSTVSLILVLGALLVFRSEAQPSPAPNHGIMVAVLPFDQQTKDPRFLSVGLWEQTRGALTGNSSIKVLGRATTEAMAKQGLAPDGYLRRFGVTHVLEGSVRQSGDELVVSVSLTRTSDGIAEWQNVFRGHLGEPFALQETIASDIEGKLRAQFAPGGGRKAEQIATMPEVYAAYSDARELVSTRDDSGARRAEALLRGALQQDPNYAPAWSLLGAAIYLRSMAAIVDPDARAEATRDVQHALWLAPNFAPAHATLALIQGEQSREAEASLRQAVALDPSYSEAWNWLGNSLNAQGRVHEATLAYWRAIDIDPLLYPAVVNLFDTASNASDQSTIDRLFKVVRKSGADEDLIDALKARHAYRQGDFSATLGLLRKRGLDPRGQPRTRLWSGWYDALTAIGFYDELHNVTGCPDWYGPLLQGKILPPTSFGGKPVTAEAFWTSEFFSGPAARAMVRLRRPAELVQLYRAGFRNLDDFISRSDRRNALPELATDLAMALNATGAHGEANYLLSATSRRLEEAIRRTPERESLARLALVRAAQKDRGRAIALLEAALARGWFPDGHTIALDLEQEPSLTLLSGDQRFESIRQRLLNHIAKERAELGPMRT